MNIRKVHRAVGVAFAPFFLITSLPVGAPSVFDGLVGGLAVLLGAILLGAGLRHLARGGGEPGKGRPPDDGDPYRPECRPLQVGGHLAVGQPVRHPAVLSAGVAVELDEDGAGEARAVWAPNAYRLRSAARQCGNRLDKASVDSASLP